MTSSTIEMADLVLRLAEAEEREGDHKAAISDLQKAAMDYKELGSSKYWLAISLLGNLQLSVGSVEAARINLENYHQWVSWEAAGESDNFIMQHQLALSWQNLGAVYQRTGSHPSLILRCLQSHHQLAQQLLLTKPRSNTFRNSAAIASTRMGEWYAQKGDQVTAARYFAEHYRIAVHLARKRPDDFDLRDSLGAAASKLAEYHLESGHYSAALRYLNKVITIYQALSDDQPINIRYKENLGIGYQKLGVYYSVLEEIKKAHAAIQRAVGISEQIAESAPEHPAYQDGLARDLEKLGNSYLAMGRITQAWRSYCQSHRISERLAEKYPEQPQFLHGLGISTGKQAILYKQSGKLQQALSLAQRSYDIQSRLCKVQNQNGDFTNGLAKASEQMGDILLELSDLDGALTYYNECCTLAGQLHDADPRSADDQHYFAVANSKTAQVYLEKHDIDRAEIYCLRYYELEKQLIRRFPANPRFKNSLAIACSRLGQLCRSRMQLGKALHYFKRYHRYEKQLLKSYPDNPSYRSGVAVSFSRLSGTFVAAGEPLKALAATRGYVFHARHLARRTDLTIDMLKSFGIALIELGDVLRLNQLSKKAGSAFNRALNFLKDASQKFTTPETLNLLAVAYDRCGDHCADHEQPKKALRMYLEGSQLLKVLFGETRDVINVGYNLALSIENIGQSYFTLGQVDRAENSFLEAIILYERLVAMPEATQRLSDRLALNYFRLGALYLETGRPADEWLLKANRIWMQLSNLNPTSAFFLERLNLIRPYFQLPDKEVTDGS